MVKQDEANTNCTLTVPVEIDGILNKRIYAEDENGQIVGTKLLNSYVFEASSQAIYNHRTNGMYSASASGRTDIRHL